MVRHSHFLSIDSAWRLRLLVLVCVCLWATPPATADTPLPITLLPSASAAAEPVVCEPAPGQQGPGVARGSRRTASGPIGAACFDPGTPQDQIDRFYALHPEWLPPAADPRYNIGTNWTGQQGVPTSLMWSLVPDGVEISGGAGEPISNSELFSRMDALFASQGGRATWIARIQACFDRWQQLTGVTYTRVTFGGNDWDDGAVWGMGGAAGLRGDVRISMHLIDGGSGILAYNYFPPSGDMVLDRGENWASSANTHRFMRNIIMHEHGHGLGIFHVCPLLNSRLMEPFLATNFDGPQHDEIRAAQRMYGDKYEPNENAAGATNLGTLDLNGTFSVTLGPVPSPAITSGSLLSIDGAGKDDWFKFTVTEFIGVTAVVAPQGFTYDSSTQSCSGQSASCCSGNPIDSLAIANLNVQVVGMDGTTVIATGNSSPAGGTETLSNIPLTGAPGTFYIRVFTPDGIVQSQLYWLTVTLASPTADIVAPSPNPPTWLIEPRPDSTTSIAMASTPATDQTPPIEYFFDYQFGAGGHDSPWTSSSSYVDLNLAPNSSYTYRFQTRDSVVPTRNVSSFSSSVTGSTHIQTPTGVSVGTVTQTSIDVTATGTFSFLTSGSSGIFFEMVPDVPGSGANTWNQTTALSIVNLTPNTQYTIRAKARNRQGFETTLTGPQVVTTLPIPGQCVLLGDVNDDGFVNADDIAGFVRVKLGTPVGGDIVECADYGNNDLLLDTDDFVADLLEL